MKKILVATDFSSNSESAIVYAIKLANIFNAELEILNSYISIPAIGIDGGTGAMSAEIAASGIQSNKVKLDEWMKKLMEDAHFNGRYKTWVSYGDPVIEITNYASENNIDMIVMGSKGDSKLEELLFGSTTVDVMKRAHVPVLSVPLNSKFFGIKKIVYATDLDNKDVKVIKKLCDFASFFDAEVVVFHVFTEDNMLAQEDADEFKLLLRKEIEYPKFSRESVTYANTHDAILDVIKKDLANIIALREHERGLFGRLFHMDMVKRINDHTTIPLLTYNDKSLT